MNKRNQYALSILLCVVLSCQFHEQDIGDKRVNGILSMEKLGDSIIFITNWVDSESPNTHEIYSMNLINLEVISIISKEFDGRYTNLFKISDSTFACEIQYDYESELSRKYYDIAGKEYDYDESEYKLLVQKQAESERLREHFAQLLYCNVWKVNNFRNSYILSTNSFGDSSIHNIVIYSEDSTKMDTLSTSTSPSTFCVENETLFWVESQKLYRKKLSK